MTNTNDLYTDKVIIQFNIVLNNFENVVEINNNQLS